MKNSTSSVVIYGQGETLAYHTSLEQLRAIVGFADATIVTTLPRGGFQTTQPRQTHQRRLRTYNREAYVLDAVAWNAMGQRRPLRPVDLADDPAFGPVVAEFKREFLDDQDLPYYCCVPLRGPVLDGFPGFLQLFRTRDSGDFTEHELQRLMHVAEEFDAAASELRSKRAPHSSRMSLRHVLPSHQFAMTLEDGFVFPADISALDEVVRQNLLTQVTAVLQKASDRESEKPSGDDAAAVINNTDRLLVSDRLGDSWVFRLVVRRRIPGLTGSGQPVALVSLQPEPDAWAKIRPSDFAADEELSRLVPALQYMRQNFAGESSLDDVAKTVHLSPFHFHRRFAELLGVTPKHYMFDCQIAEAKRLLVAQEKDLREVAEVCGFAHQSHFTSRFKQATGLTPTAWRRIALGAMGTNRP